MRNPRKRCAMVILISGLFSGAAFAHHSFASFDHKKEMHVSGTVAELQYTNPHAWLFVDVPTATGAAQIWTFELGSQNLLIRGGWLKNTVQVGMKVSVAFHPLRDGKRGGSVTTIVLPDGRKLSGE